MKQVIAGLIDSALKTLIENGTLPSDVQPNIMVENTRDKSHGDYASNIALTLAKPARSNPRQLAEKLVAALPQSENLTRTEIAGPGFINFFISEASTNSLITTILDQKENYGRNNDGAGKKVQVEFVSANPTGPLHIGHGRGAAVGDCLCRIMDANGWDVTREFYYNDAGQQINNLALSVQARCKNLTPDDASWPEDGYRGDYIVELAESYMQGDTVKSEDQSFTGAKDADDLESIRHFAVAYLRREQDLDLKAFAVDFDVYFLESSLYSEGKVEAAVQTLIKNGFTYEDGGALWLRTTDFGDDKDRVVRRANGQTTYFASDIAYHLNKFERGFDRVINIWGADHHGYITRVKASLQALGIDPERLVVRLVQFAILYRGEERVQLSTRSGSFVTLRDLREEVGNDACRFFYVTRKSEQHMDFDLELAKSESKDNPVYYIQYAHARVCSVMRKLSEQDWSWDQQQGLDNLALLDSDSEKDLMTSLSKYPEVLNNAALGFEPHVLAHYLKDLASDFHTYYNSNKMIIDSENLRNARLTLSQAVRQVLANGLGLLGVSAPEQM